MDKHDKKIGVKIERLLLREARRDLVSIAKNILPPLNKSIDTIYFITKLSHNLC